MDSGLGALACLPPMESGESSSALLGHQRAGDAIDCYCLGSASTSRYDEALLAQAHALEKVLASDLLAPVT